MITANSTRGNATPVKDASVAIVERKPEKLNPGLCDTYAAL